MWQELGPTSEEPAISDGGGDLEHWAAVPETELGKQDEGEQRLKTQGQTRQDTHCHPDEPEDTRS